MNKILPKNQLNALIVQFNRDYLLVQVAISGVAAWGVVLVV